MPARSSASPGSSGPVAPACSPRSSDCSAARRRGPRRRSPRAGPHPPGCDRGGLRPRCPRTGKRRAGGEPLGAGERRDGRERPRLPALLRRRPAGARLAQQYVTELQIRTPDIETPVRVLSGGNQQKVVIGKWLAAAAEDLAARRTDTRHRRRRQVRDLPLDGRARRVGHGDPDELVRAHRPARCLRPGDGDVPRPHRRRAVATRRRPRNASCTTRPARARREMSSDARRENRDRRER